MRRHTAGRHMRAVLSGALALVLAASLAAPPAAWGGSLMYDGTYIDDVEEGDWFYPAVRAAMYFGDMTGYADTDLFGPNDVLTRGQAVTVLFHRAARYFDLGPYSATEDTAGFTDTEAGAFYTQALNWAAAIGGVHGYAGTGRFGPDDPVTRQEFAVMMENMFNLDPYPYFVPPYLVEACFSDAGDIAPWAAEGVQYLFSRRAMGGNQGYSATPEHKGTMSPLAPMLRAEAANVIYKYGASYVDI
jgi:hypothetical protein